VLRAPTLKACRCCHLLSQPSTICHLTLEPLTFALEGSVNMHRNAWEWFDHCWHEDYDAGAPADGSS